MLESSTKDPSKVKVFPVTYGVRQLDSLDGVSPGSRPAYSQEHPSFPVKVTSLFSIYRNGINICSVRINVADGKIRGGQELNYYFYIDGNYPLNVEKYVSMQSTCKKWYF